LPPRKNGELAGRVWVLDGKTPVPRDLTLGHTDGRLTEVVSGLLRASERVITDIARGAQTRN
jgi:multidrug efflux pump subunit AcrA (membrane-fusion protein)